MDRAGAEDGREEVEVDERGKASGPGSIRNPLPSKALLRFVGCWYSSGQRL